jgi:serine/threonine protein phosphatase PrpC
MRLRAGVASDRGLVRPANEDSFFLRKGLYAVCDGMGGARAGEVASQMACMGLLGLDPASAGKKELRTAVVSTNQAIVSRSLAEDKLLGMGTTLTAVMIKEGLLILAHVGDSRAYLFHEHSLVQLTDDHSWVGEMVRRGEITVEQAAIHPHRSVITRALGTDREVDPDIKEITVTAGDRIVLCSDGLTGMVTDEQIAELLAEAEPPQATAEALVKAALEAGGEDNVTVVVVDIEAAGPQGAEEDEGDQVGDQVLLGPSDRGASVGAAPHRGRKAGAAVRERLGRVAPVLRPVGARSALDSGVGADGGVGAEAAEAALGAEAAAERLPATEEPAAPEGPAPRAVAPPVGAGPAPAPAKAGASLPAKGKAAVTSLGRGRRRKWLYVAVAVIVILAIAVAAFAYYNSSVYYVGKYDDGTVALYRGLPGDFLGIELSEVVESAGVDYDSLAPYLQRRVDAHDLVSKEEGRAFLRTLSEQQ